LNSYRNYAHFWLQNSSLQYGNKGVRTDMAMHYVESIRMATLTMPRHL